MSDLPAIRASDAEREQAVVRLRDASAEGRLTLEEFTERMAAAYEARTHEDLDVLVRDLPERVTSVPERKPPARRWIVSVMGNVERRGRWRVGERTFVIASMSNTVVDLREAVLSGPEVRIFVFCSMGNVSVLVPKGVDVELSVVALMGHKEDRSRSELKPGAPLVRITGLVSMGSIFVRQR